jgi:hypothetical protein
LAFVVLVEPMAEETHRGTAVERSDRAADQLGIV